MIKCFFKKKASYFKGQTDMLSWVGTSLLNSEIEIFELYSTYGLRLSGGKAAG
jgi:hypothetical protein